MLLITSEGIDELIAQGFSLFPGALGENLTTAGLDRRLMRPGQRYRAGEVFLELTRLRGPCAALDVYGPGLQKAIYDPQVKAGDPSIASLGPQRILRAGSQSGNRPPAGSNRACGPACLALAPKD